jgi:hypothetical protein
VVVAQCISLPIQSSVVCVWRGHAQCELHLELFEQSRASWFRAGKCKLDIRSRSHSRCHSPQGSEKEMSLLSGGWHGVGAHPRYKPLEVHVFIRFLANKVHLRIQYHA